MLNIVIPMAGAGSRFSKAGFGDPKPLVKIHGTPMIRLVIENVRPRRPHRYIFICQRQHVMVYGLIEKLTAWAPGAVIVQIDGVTEGAACTVLKAQNLIDNENPLMIVNSDQYVDIDINAYLEAGQKADGLVMTMTANNPKFSFVGFDAEGKVERLVEKEVISDEATVGIYNFRQGQDFVRAAEAMIHAKRRSNGEYYIAPTYNELLSRNAHIEIYNIGQVGKGMYALGTPEDLQFFLSLPISETVARKYA